MKQVFSWLLVLSFLLALSVPAAAANDATGKTLRLEETTGSVTVRDASGKNKAVRAGMRLYSGYTVETGASSSAYISLDETKAVKLDSSGKAEIKKSGKKLEVALTAGQIFFNVTQPLKVDESLNIRTSTMVTGIRGSFGWVNPTQLGLMHGHVTLSCTNPDTGETRATEVFSGEKVSYEQAAQASGGAGLAEIGFTRETIVVADVPAIVVEEVKNDATLQTQLAEDAAAAKAADENAVVIDVTELVESLETKQAEEKAAEATAQAAVEEAAAVQEDAIAASAAEDKESGATNQLFTTETASSSDDDSGGGYAMPATTPTAYSTGAISELLQAFLDAISAAFPQKDITFTGTGTASDNMTIRSGKTLTVASGANLTIDSGKTLTIDDGASLTVANGATLTLNGTVNNLSGHTLTNNGTLIVNGTFCNGGATAGRFVNNGKLEFGTDGKLTNKANGTLEGSGFNVSNVFYTISYNTNGGTEIAARELASGTALSTVIPTPAPTKEGYAFDGWYTDAALTTEFDPPSDTAITANLTLYAKWLPMFTISWATGTGTVPGTIVWNSVTGANLYRILIDGNEADTNAPSSGTACSFDARSLLGNSLMTAGNHSITVQALARDGRTVLGTSGTLKANVTVTNDTISYRAAVDNVATNGSEATGTIHITFDNIGEVNDLGNYFAYDYRASTHVHSGGGAVSSSGYTISGARLEAAATLRGVLIESGTDGGSSSGAVSGDTWSVTVTPAVSKVLISTAGGDGTTSPSWRFVDSDTVGVLYVHSVGEGGKTVTGQIDGGTAAVYALADSSAVISLAAGGLYLVNYNSAATGDTDNTVNVAASLSSTQVRDQYNHEKTLKTKEGTNVTYTINDGAIFYNIVRTAEDSIGTVTRVSGWPDLNDGTTVYIVTAAGGGNLATAVYYVTIETGT